MKVKLYEGCWGVTRGGHIVGPASYSASLIEVFIGDMATPWCFPDGWRSSKGVLAPVGEKSPQDIIRVFPSRESAEAWVNRKLWWKRPFFQGFFDWRAWAWGAGLGILAAASIAILTSCTSPTSPAHSTERKCWTDDSAGWVEVPCNAASERWSAYYARCNGYGCNEFLRDTAFMLGCNRVTCDSNGRCSATTRACDSVEGGK